MILRNVPFIVLMALFTGNLCYSQVPRLEWAKSIRGNNAKVGYAVAVDAGGNVYSTGVFFGTADFDPGPGVFNLTSNGSGDIYILKQNPDGDLVWVNQIGGVDFEEPRGLAVDAGGQVHVGGTFESAVVDFDPGTGAFEITNIGVIDAFVLKLDTDGNLIWAKQLAGTDDEAVHGLALDLDGNILTTGYFSTVTDFDPGIGTFDLTSSSAGVADIFVSKLDENGNFVWAKSIGSSNYEVAYAIAVDGSKNVIISGELPGGQPIDLDPGTGTFEVTPTGSSNSLLLKLNETGDLVWAKVLDGDQVLSAITVATDNLDNIYVGGGFEGTPDFDPNTGTFSLTAVSSYDAFILKLKSDGTFDWVRNFGTTGYQNLYSLTTNTAREVIATGQFEDIVDFDPGGSTFDLTPRGSRDIFLTKLDENGDFVWAGQMGGDGGNEFAYSVFADDAGNIYSTGYFEGANDFDPSLCEFDLVAIDDFDVYLVKVGTAIGCSFAISQQPQSVTTCLGETATFTVEAVGTTNIQYQWQIYNDGIPDFLDLADGGNFSGTNSSSFSISNVSLANGDVYRCKISGDGFSDIFSNEVTLTVIAPPVAPNVSRCGAGPVTLLATGGTNGQYRWYTTASGGTPLTGETNNSFTTPSLSTSTTYYVSIDLGTCETDRTPVTATINSCAPIPELVWARGFGGNGYGLSITSDAAGNVYTTGFYRGATDFDPGPGTVLLPSNGSTEAYISKLDAAGNLLWAKAIEGDSDAQGNSIAVDNNGNVYAAGIFRSTADFDPGPGSFPLTSFGGFDVFILKLDQNGDFVWARQIGSTSLSGDGVSTIRIDGAGNVCTFGYFRGTVDFNPGAGTFNLSSAGQTDLFISKLDPDGNFISALKFGASDFDLPGGMFIDELNEIYCTGYFQGTSDLDPGAGTFNVVSAGGDDVFITKLNAAGNFVWAKQVGGPGDDVSTSVSKDDSGNIILTGYYENTIDLDPGTGVSEFTAAGQSDVFIIKLTSLGDFVWGKSIGGLAEDRSQASTTDGDNNVFITGSFYQTVDFDPGPGDFSITSFGQQDIFTLKLTPDGDFFWGINMGGTLSDFATGISLDGAENIFTTGGFRGNADFDPGSNTTILSAEGGSSTFVQKLIAPTPVISIDLQPQDAVVCNGATATFVVAASGTSNISYQWQFSPDGTTFSDITNGPAYSGATTATLSVITTGNFGEGRYRCRINGDFASEVTSDDEGLFITAGPAPPVPSGNARCGDGSVTLSVTGAADGQYRWYDVATGGVPLTGEVNSIYTTGSLSGTTTYYVSINDGSCESDRVAVVATINPLPAQPTITSSITPVAGTVIVCDAAPLVLSAPAGFASYAWSSGETTDQINVTLAGSYTVTVTDAAGCTSPLSDPITVITDTTPASPTVTGASSCGPGSVTLTASGDTNGNYRWYDVATGGTALAGEVNSTFTTPSLTTSATYFVSITNGNCESNRVAVTATVNAVPAQPVISSSITPVGNAISICSTTSLTLSAPAGFTYLWSDGSTTQQITVTASGTYSVVVSTAGCASPASDAINVTLVPAPCNNQPPVITTTSLTTTIGSLVTINLLTLISDPDNNLVASSLAIVQGPASGAVASINSGVLMIDYTGLNFAGTDFITIEVCDVFGACTQEQLEIEVIGEIEIYNAVSPNNDGLNEFLDLRYIDLLPDTQENKVTIYNRWGTAVFEVENYNEVKAFRGISSSGNELPSGTYFFKVFLKSTGKTITGYLDLKR